MRLLVTGLLLALLGLGTLLAQTAGAVAPGLLISLLSYALAFTGIILAIAGIIQLRGQS
ncbi:MAG: hypothetical protein JJU06_14205 [Ectothiorhodospiraceae bacterium]|nr:hypothetical protein [Ectothiorhodospiraceae bacterium]MCH8506159.1 hypothetical protein [Ectothiorhodospiraceae bacterium]